MLTTHRPCLGLCKVWNLTLRFAGVVVSIIYSFLVHFVIITSLIHAYLSYYKNVSGEVDFLKCTHFKQVNFPWHIDFLWNWDKWWFTNRSLIRVHWMTSLLQMVTGVGIMGALVEASSCVWMVWTKVLHSILVGELF